MSQPEMWLKKTRNDRNDDNKNKWRFCGIKMEDYPLNGILSVLFLANVAVGMEMFLLF